MRWDVEFTNVKGGGCGLFEGPVGVATALYIVKELLG